MWNSLKLVENICIKIKLLNFLLIEDEEEEP